MRKMVPMALALGLGFSMYQPAILAAEPEIEVEETKEVNRLSMDKVVELGLKRNSVLLLLDYQMGILAEQKSQLELDRKDLKSDLQEVVDKRRDLRDQREDLEDMIDGLTGDISALHGEIGVIQAQLAELDPEVDAELIAELQALLSGYQAQLGAMGEAVGKGGQAKESLKQGIEGLETQIEALEDAVIQMDLAVDKLAVGELKLELEAEETKALMEMMLKSSYFQLVMLKEQQAFQEQMTEQVKKEINSMKRRVELGLESSFELEKAQRKIEDQERDIQQSEKEFQRQLARLALEIDIPYHENIELAPIDLGKLSHVTQRDTNSLIEESFALKKSDHDLETARLDLAYARSEGTRYEIQKAELEQKVAEENRRQLLVDSRKYIEDLYFEADKAYQEIAKKERNLYNAESDYQKLQRQHDLGLLSSYQYEQAEVQVKQAAFELHMAKMSYYILAEQVKNMHAGVLR